ncbi:MAG TPA: hypothetical protein VFA41_11815 [Ktedonobacteraceae bacterium]|jgi:hypothetical protein|nr:hypothetical protein [Ktedonobacteraceae bacterium]
MPKINNPGNSGDSNASNKNNPPAAQPASSSKPGGSGASKGKSSGKNRRPTIGGTAVPGAKSTQPKIIPEGQQMQERPEMYNREMRRRMQQMGTGPYSEPAPNVMQKRKEKREKRREEVKKTVVTRGPSTNIQLGRRNLYFLLGAVALIVLIIVIAILVRFVF